MTSEWRHVLLISVTKIRAPGNRHYKYSLKDRIDWFSTQYADCTCYKTTISDVGIFENFEKMGKVTIKNSFSEISDFCALKKGIYTKEPEAVAGLEGGGEASSQGP